MRHGNGWKKRVTEVAVASCKLRDLGSNVPEYQVEKCVVGVVGRGGGHD